MRTRDDLFESAFEDFDENDPLWVRAGLMADAPPRPAKGYVTVPLAWLARVRPLLRSVEQVLTLQVVYRRCLLTRSRSVTLPNGELVALGISRYGKYRALSALSDAGLVSIEARNGRAVWVTLNDFP